MSQKQITVVGAGILGLWQALALTRAGHRVRLVEASKEPFAAASSRFAAAMLAPECEAESAPQAVRNHGREGLKAWKDIYPGLASGGTLVVAAVRDRAELTRFQRVTEGHRLLHAGLLGELEPQLGERFDSALYYAGEAHMDARAAMGWILDELRGRGADVAFGETHVEGGDEVVIDCRGIAARDALADLRGVRGERILIETPDVTLTRAVRLLHPRQPIYVVPQGDGRFVIGATVVEREDDGPMTIKSALDLLGAAFALHPAFAEAAILNMGAGVRPAFPDNVPRIGIEAEGRTIRVNGAYRHGFLLAPVLAQAVVDFIATGARHPLMA